MRPLADEIDGSTDPGEGQLRTVPPGVIAAGVVAAVLGVGIVGWLIFRNRRRMTLGRRLRDLQGALPDRVRELQGAIPDRVRDLPADLGARIRRVR